MVTSSASSGSTASALPANMSLSLALAIRDEEKKQKSPAQEMPMEDAFKCQWCPQAFKTARARGGHQKAHRKLPAFQENKKANKVRRRVFSLQYSYATALRSAYFRVQPYADWCSHYDPSAHPVPPSFPWQTGTSNETSVAALAAGGTDDGGRLGRQQDVREVIQEEPANGIDLNLKL